MSVDRTYILISPCRNEADFMRRTLDSVAAQTIPPTEWIVVDDGSTDATQEILNEYQSRLPYLRVITRHDRGKRSVGPGVIEAFYAGYEQISKPYEYLCKLDMDLDLPKTYFEQLITEMEAEPKLGTISGKVFVRSKDGLETHEVRGDENSVGPAKFYRKQAFQDIGGFERHVGWDGIDGFQCRRHGWIARSIMKTDLKIIHLRPMGSSDRGILRGRLRGGAGLYYIGYSPGYVLARCIVRWKEKPIIIGTLFTLYGYLKALVFRRKRFGDSEYKRQLKLFQYRALFLGRTKAVQLANQDVINQGE